MWATLSRLIGQRFRAPARATAASSYGRLLIRANLCPPWRARFSFFGAGRLDGRQCLRSLLTCGGESGHACLGRPLTKQQRTLRILNIGYGRDQFSLSLGRRLFNDWRFQCFAPCFFREPFHFHNMGTIRQILSLEPYSSKGGSNRLCDLGAPGGSLPARKKAPDFQRSCTLNGDEGDVATRAMATARGAHLKSLPAIRTPVPELSFSAGCLSFLRPLLPRLGEHALAENQNFG